MNYNFQSDPNTLLIIWNKNPVNGHGILGTFNIYGSSWNPTKQMYTAIPGNTESSQRVIKGNAAVIQRTCGDRDTMVIVLPALLLAYVVALERVRLIGFCL